MSRSTAQLVSIISAIVVVLICFFFVPSGNKTAMIIVLVIYMPFALYLQSCQRCKHCGRRPRKGDFLDEYCPHCGEPLE